MTPIGQAMTPIGQAMNSAQRQTLQNNIKQRIKELEALLTPVTTGNGESEQADDASASLDNKIASAVTSQVTENEKRELSRLKANLQWLESDDAGFCQQCGNEIPFARLQAVPVTRLCVNCAK